MNALNFIPVIPQEKRYWLVRTQGGRYYDNYKRGGFIAINWDQITYEDIDSLSPEDLVRKVKKEYPDKPNAQRSANMLRIFHQLIKPGDAVVITGPSSNVLSIGEITDEPPYIEIVTEQQLEANPRLCPYQKRRRVKWLNTVNKVDVEKDLFQLLQHAQHTISEANSYADSIERLIRNFYIRGDQAHLVLQVKKEGKIPMPDFYRMGSEIIDLVEQFSKESKDFSINLEEVEIKVNVQSPGMITFGGKLLVVSIIGFIIVAAVGGGVTIPLPPSTGMDPIEIHLNGAIREVSDFLDKKQARDQQELLLKTHMEHLDVKAPDDLVKLLKAVESVNGQNTTSEK
ncbi:hypothetical protein [Brevibacillus porteri]|uniref:hypothetical protein n=1 Tax=Brevibacillus porteri TaxID=2126350 RepID=UPI003D23471C